MIDKHAALREIRAALGAELAVMRKAAHDARHAATHEESKPENDKDTRGLELAYLAGAQAERARELERIEALLDRMVIRDFAEGAPIALSALVELEHDGASQLYFIAPHGGGLRPVVGGREVIVITPQSPIGRELLGKTAGDEIVVTTGARAKTYAIAGAW